MIVTKRWPLASAIRPTIPWASGAVYVFVQDSDQTDDTALDAGAVYVY